MAELLSVPLKKSSDVDIVKPLRNLIEATYSGAEGVDECNESLEELARLRAQAIWKLYDKSSLDVIYNYYDQLVSLESKLPPQEVAIPFKWKDAFDRGSIFGGRMSLTVSSLAYERVCVAFNMAALQSAHAAQQTLDTEDSLKLAAKLCQQAAGLFTMLKGSTLAAVQQEPTPDLAPDTLAALAALMLAQAQELIAYKCIRDGMKDSMVAKVCSAAEEMYTDTVRAMQREPQRSLWDREWLPTVQGKQLAFKGLAQLYQAAASGAAGRPGERVARLAVAADALRSAAARLPSASALTEAAARAQRQLQEAQRDNDFIYHERVPDAAQLEAVPRAAVAKPTPPPEPPARWGSGRLLLERLVPLAVHAALTGAAARRADLAHATTARLRDATGLLNAVLASLSLPACAEEAAAGGGAATLPPAVARAAAEVAGAGGAAALAGLMAELPELLQRNRDILTEAERLLREEAEADAALRAQFGSRWTRTPSDKLTESFRANAAKYAQIIDNAVRADSIVQNKFRQHKENIELLARGEEELARALPAAAGGASGGGAGAAAAAAELRRLMREVDALKAERDQLDGALQAGALPEGLRAAAEEALRSRGAVDEAALAEAVDAALQPLRERADASLAAQERLVADVQRAHAALLEARGGGGLSDREEALGRLAAAADAYSDLTGNLREGIKFYNDLTQLLVAFQNKVSDFCFARKTEKEELLKDLTQEASRSAPAAPPAPAVEPAAQRREAPPRPAPPAPAAPAAPAAGAPSALPYPAQPQGMPLPYSAYSSPYYAAPMPVAYNPYATLPYPHHVRPYQPQQQPQQPYPQQPYQQQPYQQPPYQPQQPYPQQQPHGYSPYGPPPQ